MGSAWGRSLIILMSNFDGVTGTESTWDDSFNLFEITIEII